MKEEFLQNDISRRTMKNLAALAFFPPQNVIEEFIRIKESASEVLDGKNYRYSSYYFVSILLIQEKNSLIIYAKVSCAVMCMRANVLARYSRTLYIRA